MLLRLQNALASMSSTIREQERIANNLANANTVGFRRHRTFTETLDEYIDIEGGPQSVRSQGEWASLEQGALESTGNPLDFAIRGAGFFVLSDEGTGQQRFSRAGRFAVDGDGMLRNPTGHLVEGDGGPIRLPVDAQSIDVAKDGTIEVDGEVVGRLRIVQFAAPEALTRLDDASFDAAGMEAVDVDNPSVIQGHIEGSNVNPISEMTDMIAHFRLFESQQKMIQTTDQVLGSVTRELGRF